MKASAGNIAEKNPTPTLVEFLFSPVTGSQQNIEA